MEHFVFKKEWREALKGYSAEVRAEVYEAVLAYAFEGEVLPMSELAKMAFNFIKLSIDAMQEAYQEKCNRNRENIAKRWKKHDNDTTEYEDIPNDTTEYEDIPNDTYTNQIKSNQIKSKCVSKKRTHTHEAIFEKFKIQCRKVAPLALEFKEPLTIDQFAKLYDTYGWQKVAQCATELHNKEACKKSRKAYTTWLSFMENIK